jgi:hypothetical protein
VPLQLAPGETLGPSEPSRPIAPLRDPVLLKVGEPWELRALAEALQEHGISSQIDSYPLGGSLPRGLARGQPARLGIYVGRADVEAVREFASQLAALEGSEAGAAEASHDPTTCPACGEPTPENAAACSACGLEFPEVNPEEAP